MRKNKVYVAVSLLALLAMLLPAKLIFARTEAPEANRVEDDGIEASVLSESRDKSPESEGDRVKIDDRQIDDSQTGSVKQEDDGDKVETGTLKEEKDGENEAEMHRSAVSSFVENLLEVADKNKDGVGEDVRVIAKEEDDAEENVSKAVEEVKGRSSLKTFLIGTDYKNIGMIRSEMAKTQNRLDKLNGLLEKMSTSTGATTTLEQIQNLTETQTKLEDFLQENENKFSLFGWFVKLFNR